MERVHEPTLDHRNPFLVTLEALTGATAVIFLLLITTLTQVASSFETWLFAALAGKPLLDLAWRWNLGEFAKQRMNVQAVVGALVVLLTMLTAMRRRKELVYSRGVLALAAVAFVSVAITPTAQGLNELLRLYAGISVFLTAGVVLNDEARFAKFAGWFLAAVSVPIFLSFGQVLGLLPFEYWDWIDGQSVGRASGTYQHPLGLIMFLIYALPLSLYLLGQSKGNPIPRYLVIAFITACSGAALASMHRMGWMAMGIQVVLWSLMVRQWTKAEIVAGFSAIVVLGIIFSSSLLVMYKPALDALQGKTSIFSDEFLRGRGLQWYVFLSSYLRGGPKGWLLGLGGSTARGYVPGFGFWESDEPHNDFIRILHAYGVLGLGFYLSILWRLVGLARKLRRLPDLFSQVLGTIALTVVPSIVLLSITDEPMRFPTAAWYLFALASTVEVRYRTTRGFTHPAPIFGTTQE